MSPDEDVVALESTSEAASVDGKTMSFTEVVSTFAFKKSKVLAEYRLTAKEVEANAKSRFDDPVRGCRFVRFTPDGRSLVALVARVIYVFPALNLTAVREIPLLPPPPVVHYSKNRESKDVPQVQGLEISPSGHFAAVLWVIGNFNARIDIYDLVSDIQLGTWYTPAGSLATTTPGLVWSVDESAIIMAIPNGLCSTFPSDADVFEFSAITGAIGRKLTTGLLSGPVALSSDDRVFVGDSNCPRFHERTRLRVFSFSTGKEVHSMNGPGSGKRYFGVVASQNRKRFLVFTKRMLRKFDWLDMTSYESGGTETFTVWNMEDYFPVVTSQSIPGLHSADVRMSPQGHFVVVAGNARNFAHGTSAVFELP
jgi:hypothetical protein